MATKTGFGFGTVNKDKRVKTLIRQLSQQTFKDTSEDAMLLVKAVIRWPKSLPLILRHFLNSRGKKVGTTPWKLMNS